MDAFEANLIQLLEKSLTMAEVLARARMSSVLAFVTGSDNIEELPEDDLRWRRNSQAALTSMLPSRTAIHSDSGLTLLRKLSVEAHKQNGKRRRSTITSIRRHMASVQPDGTFDDTTQVQTSVIELFKTSRRCSHDEDALIEDYVQTKENIKSMTASLAVKRKYRDQLVREKSYEFETLVQLGYSRAKAWHNFKSHVKNLVYQLEVWAGSFKVIEGHFGSSTVSYFRFLRFLMFLNLYLTLVIFGVVVIPHFILPDDSIDKEQYIETYDCSESYNKHTEQVKRNSSNAGNIALAILQGTGLLENTVLFYGKYYNLSLSAPISGEHRYNMSLAYLMATGATFVLSFLLLVKNSAKGVKQGILERSGGNLTHQFFNKVFGGWDFCVSSESTASIKHKSLKHELETDLEYQRLYWRKQNRTAKEKLKLVFIRLLINLLCFGILGASLYLIFYVNEKLIDLRNEAEKVTEILVLLVQYLPSVTITLLSTIVPIIFTRLILAEEYTPSFQIRLTLFRIVLLRLASLGVLMLSLFTTIKNNEGNRCGNSLSNLTTNHSDCAFETSPLMNKNCNTVGFIGFNETNQLECWETYLGQQIYKLVIMNFIVVIAVTFLWEFPRKLIYMKFNHLKFVKLLGQQEFDLARNVLDLVYLQTLSWLGLFFSPLIPAMCCLTNFIFFYVKKLSLLRNCVPHQHYRTSRSSSLFVMVLLLSFALSTIPIIYMIGSIHPSRTCGPFRKYGKEEDYFIFTVITHTISNWPEDARLVFTYIGKGSVMFAFALLVCLVMYYFWMVSQGYIKQEELLRGQLKLSGELSTRHGPLMQHTCLCAEQSSFSEMTAMPGHQSGVGGGHQALAMGAKISHTDYIPLPLREPVMMDDRQEDIHDTTLVDDLPQGQSGGGIETRKYRHSGGSHPEKYQQGHHMHPLPAQIYDRYVDAGTMERSPSWKRSFKQHEYPADYGMDTSINMDDSQNFKIPSFKQDNPVATIIRRRNASSRKRSTIRKREREDINEYVDVEDNHMLPSIQIQRRERHKTLRERRSTKRAKIPVGGDDLDGAKSFRERYAETKEKHDLTARNFAVLLRDTASAKLADWRRPKKWDILTKQIREFFQHFSIWSSHMRIIEGRFGTAIMSYFRFLRWLMFLNAYIMIIQFFCITVPYLALSPRTFSETVLPNASNFTQTAVKCTKEYTIYHEDNLKNETAFQKFLDFLLGTGWMERTVLFYGEYFNKTYYMPDGEKTYDMGLAYLLSAGVSFVISFILIVKNSSKAIKGTFGMERSVAMYCNRVFCSWDYCISNKKAAKVKKKNLLIDFRESLEEQRKTWEKAEESKIRLFGIRVAINLFILGILIGALYLVYYTTDRLLELQKQKLDDIVAFIVQYVPTVTITILNFVIPIVFQKIVVFEKYSSRVEINVTLARSVILRLASLVVLIGTLYRLLIIEHTGFPDCGNTKWGDSNMTTKGNIKCWETYVGQQIYKLVLLDLIVETGIILIVQFPRRLIYDKYQKKHKLVQKLGPNQFDLAQNVIDIVYTQTIGWFGMFFSPLIPFMTFVKCFIFFYVRKWSLLSNCAPVEKTNVTSRSNSLFMMVLLLSFIFVTVPIGYMVGYINPSQSCGPFRVYSENKTHVMFDTISLTIESWPDTARNIFFFFGTVGFLVPVMILLTLLMYYFWLLGQGYKKREKLLKNQLKLEGQDKKFLLTQVNAILMHADAGSTG